MPERGLSAGHRHVAPKRGDLLARAGGRPRRDINIATASSIVDPDALWEHLHYSRRHRLSFESWKRIFLEQGTRGLKTRSDSEERKLTLARAKIGERFTPQESEDQLRLPFDASSFGELELVRGGYVTYDLETMLAIETAKRRQDPK